MTLERAFLPEKRFMRRALELAREAAEAGEVPVGAVVVRAGEIVGEGRNRREAAGSALAHAEVEAIHRACQAVGNWRLDDCVLYVTLEPCPMCTGALLNAHIPQVVYGADDEKAGCCGTAADLRKLPFAREPQIYRGFCEEECRELLRAFFQSLRS